MPKKLTLTIFFLIIITGAFLRLYGSLDKLGFSGDIIRDISTIQLIWERISTFSFSSLPLKGPQLEPPLGIDAHHGAFYFYLLTLPAVITNFNPYGIIVFIIFLNITAIWLIYILASQLVDNLTGLITAFMFSISNLAITYSGFIWNPNLIIFFSLLTLVSFLKISQGNKKYWPLFSFSAAATTQIHILGYALISFTFIPLLLTRKLYPSGKVLLYSSLCFLIPVLPELLFQLFSRSPLYIFYVGSKFIEIFSSEASSLLTNIPFAIAGLGLILILSSILIIVSRLKILYIKDTVLLATWSLSSLPILILSIPHFKQGINHPLLFVLPLFLIIYAIAIRYFLTNIRSTLIGVVFLIAFIYYNFIFSTPYDNYLYQPEVRFKDANQFTDYLINDKTTQDLYDLHIPDHTVYNSIRWFLSWRQVTLPKELVLFPGEENIKDPGKKYILISLKSRKNYKLPDEHCSVTNSFGYLQLYTCQ